MSEIDQSEQSLEVSPDAVGQALYALFAAQSEEEVAALLEQHQSLLLTDMADHMLAAKIAEFEHRQDPSLHNAIATLFGIRFILARAREAGIHIAIKETIESKSADPAILEEEFAHVMEQWLMIAPPNEQRAFLEKYQVLLLLDSDRILQRHLDQLHETPEDIANRAVLRHRLNILHDARQRGGTIQAIREAYVNFSSGFSLDLPIWLEKMLRQIESLNDAGPVAAIASKRRVMLLEAIDRAGKASLDPALQAELTALLARILIEERGFAPDMLAIIVQCYENVLQVYTLALYPFQYAKAKCELGLAYHHSTTNEREMHQERAIACYEEALGVFTPEDFPEQWAIMQCYLAEAYRNRMRGDRPENMQKAIGYLEAVLLVHTRETSPATWASTQINLGNVYAEPATGDAPENLERAISCFESALQIYTQEAFPVFWAILQNNLGEIYRRRIRGEQSENIEKAIHHLEAALNVRTREKYPMDWALTQSNLGTAYVSRIDGVTAENLKIAQTYYESAMQVYSYEVASMEWAKIQLQLGTLYKKAGGDDDIKKAISHYQTALQVYTPEAAPWQWLSAQLMLGEAYIEYAGEQRQENLKQAISHYTAFWQFIIQNTLLPSSELFRLMNLCLQALSNHSGRVEDLEQEAQLYCDVIKDTSVSAPVWPVVLARLIYALSDRYLRTGQTHDLEQFIALNRQVVDYGIASGSIANLSAFLNDLGVGLLRLYNSKSRLEDLDRAIQAFEEAIKRAETEKILSIYLANLGEGLYLANLGEGLLVRYIHTQQQVDLERALQLTGDAVNSLTDTSPVLSTVSFARGKCLQTQYLLTGELEYLEQAIHYIETSVQHTPVTSPIYPVYLTLLGGALNNRYEYTASLEDLEKGIEIYRKVISLLRSDSPNLPLVLYYLGNALIFRYDYAGRREDLEEAINVSRRALQMKTGFISFYPALLSNLGMSLMTRYQYYTGSTEDLEEAIKACEKAIKIVPANSFDVPRYLINLASARLLGYISTGRLADLEWSINTLQDALHRTPTKAPLHPNILIRLALVLRVYYEVTGSVAYLELAVMRSRECVQFVSINTPNAARYLTNLAQVLQTSYKRTGKREELEEMLQVLQEVATLASADTPFHYSLSVISFMGIFARYERTGRLDDLDQAIGICQRALHHVSADAPFYPELLNNLGLGLRNRYAHTENAEDLEQAIAYFERAVACVPSTYPLRVIFLSNLGGGLISRYRRAKRQEDLERATNLLHSVTLTTSVDIPVWSSLSINFSLVLRTLYEQTNTLADLEQAIEIGQEVLKHLPANSPDEPLALVNLALNLKLLYARTHQEEVKQQAIRCYEKSCVLGLELALDVMLDSARDWGGWAMDREDWAEAARAYSFGVQALGLLYREQLLRSSREIRLGDALSMHNRAAYAQARAGQLREAVVSLELGRARALSEGLARDRADLEHLQQEEQELYNRYVAQVERLLKLENADLMGEPLLDTLMNNAPIPLAEQMRLAREALEQTIAAIRCIPGYTDFLADPTYPNIALAAEPAMPLVYLATTHLGSIALLVTASSDAPEVIWADYFASDDLMITEEKDGLLVGGYFPGQSIAPWMMNTLTVSLPRIGTDLIQPVARRLRDLNATGVVLVPTGLLGILPFHAASYWLDGREICLLDEFNVAYTPSARILVTARHEARVLREVASPHLVGVGNPLPDVSTGEWAQRKLQEIFPPLQQHIEATLQSLKNTHLEALLQKLKQGETLLDFWLDALHEVYQYSKEQPEILIQRGKNLQKMANLFTNFPETPDDIKAVLRSICERIPMSLDHAHTELASIQKMFSPGEVVALYESEATRDALWEQLPQATLLQLSCHGTFDAKSPLDSALLLAQDTRLTLRDLLNADVERLAGLRLVVLSACQTAVSDILELPNEVVGLLSGFLRTGVPAIIGALWSVDEISTALLIVRFYTLYLYGEEQSGLLPQQPLIALRQAQRWLRDLSNTALLAHLKEQAQSGQYDLAAQLQPGVRCAVKAGDGEVCPYAHPYYWAGFVYYGAW